MVRRLNVDGDGQGDLKGHGGVNRRGVRLPGSSPTGTGRTCSAATTSRYGQFGENFTVEGLADEEVCIGDRYRIGSALFEVSQPRVTCYRVGIRMNEPRMPALLVAHRRPGFYLRVLEEGEVGAGDAIERLERGPEAMTVAEVDGLLYLPGHARRDLVRALRIPALSEGWQGSFRELLEQTPAVAVEPPAWAGLRQMRVAAIEPREHERDLAAPDPGRRRARAARAARPVPDGAPATGPRRRAAAAHLLAVGRLRAPTSYRISVKREPHGAASGYLHTGCASATSSRPARRAAPSCCVRAIARSCSSAPGSGRRRCWRCCTCSPPRARRGRCGGCTALATAPSTRSGRRPPRCSPSSRRAPRRVLQPSRPGTIGTSTSPDG